MNMNSHTTVKMPPLTGPEYEAFKVWWADQKIESDNELVYRMIAWNGWIARASSNGPDSGYCPHCGMDPFRRCVPPRDHTQCAFFKQRQSATERSEP